MVDPETMLAHALAAIERGCCVFPVHWPRTHQGPVRCSCSDPQCRNVAKHPYGSLVPHGFKDATNDPELLKRWWRAAPMANIGVPTGDLVVLDVDPRHGGDESLAALEAEHGPLPATWRVITGGGGEHICFSAPGGTQIKNSESAIAPGLDIRGTGGYVLAPGSLHEFGRRYEWSVDHHPDEVALSEMPPWLAQLASASRTAPLRSASEWQALVANGVAEGRRNSSIASIYGHLLRRNIDARVAFELVFSWNRTRCRPPLPDSEVETIANSIARRDLRRRRAEHGRW